MENGSTIIVVSRIPTGFEFKNIVYVGETKPLEEIIPPEIDHIVIYRAIIEDYSKELPFLPKQHYYLRLEEACYLRDKNGKFQYQVDLAQPRYLPLEERVIKCLIESFNNIRS